MTIETMQDLEEKELIEISEKQGFRVELCPDDARLARWSLHYHYRGEQGWLVTKRGARRTWASANVALRFIRDRLGFSQVLAQLNVKTA